MDYYRRIQQAVDYIEAYLREDLTIDRIAAQAHFSPYHFQRVFQAVSGFSVWEYIRKRRMAEAAGLLKDTNQSVLEIALAVQYNSQEAFTRAFEGLFGITPGQYRKAEQSLNKLAKINFLNYHPKIKGEPQINRIRLKDMPSVPVAGYAYRFDLASEQYYQDIPTCWFEFYRQGMGKKIPHRVAPRIALGVALDTCRDGAGPCELSYLIGAEVSDFEAPLDAGFQYYRIPGGKYGEFAVNGPIQTVENTFRYIYGTWFPNSSYERGEGPDIKAVQVNRSTSERFEMNILIPLK